MPDTIFKIFTQLEKRGWTMATAESCTGGLIAAAITGVPGSSAYFDRGFITYSNQAKMDMLGVSEEILAQHGAVSDETARAMVEGVFNNSTVDLAVSVTGIAGPGGATDRKPVGLVYIGFGTRGGDIAVSQHNYVGDRASVREKSAAAALQHILSLLE